LPERVHVQEQQIVAAVPAVPAVAAAIQVKPEIDE
jgi:hypothetical protein